MRADGETRAVSWTPSGISSGSGGGISAIEVWRLGSIRCAPSAISAIRRSTSGVSASSSAISAARAPRAANCARWEGSSPSHASVTRAERARTGVGWTICSSVATASGTR